LRTEYTAVFASQICEWTGIRPDCTESEITAAFSFNAGEGVAHCGTEHIEYRFRSLPAEGFSEGVFFYFVGHCLSHISADYWSFDRRECSNIFRCLGVPSFRLRFAWKMQNIEGGEMLYPNNGIALGILQETGLIAMVRVFPRCSPETYQEKYWNILRAREF
jgi:hypothetical protein